eukprot:m.288184 g.288184  ORF g.288184 m.288184 type:complete len:1009 (+) comp16220_c0_seq41:105-3131(+)
MTKRLAISTLLVLFVSRTCGRQRYLWPTVQGQAFVAWSTSHTLPQGGPHTISTRLPDSLDASFFRPGEVQCLVRALVVSVNGVSAVSASRADATRAFGSTNYTFPLSASVPVSTDQSHDVVVQWQGSIRGPCTSHTQCPLGQYCDVYGACDTLAYCSQLLDTVDGLACPLDNFDAACPNGHVQCGEDEIPCGNSCTSKWPSAPVFCDQVPECAIADGNGSSAAYRDRGISSSGADASAMKRALALARGAHAIQLVCRNSSCYENVGNECTRIEATAQYGSGALARATCERISAELLAIPGIYPNDVHVTCGCPPAPIAQQTPNPLPRIRGPLTCGAVETGYTTGGLNVPNTRHASPEHVYTLDVTLSGIYIFDSCDSSFDTHLAVFDDSQEIAECDDCGNCSRLFRARLSAHLDVGQYTILIEGHGNSSGSYSLSMECPTSTTSTLSTTTISTSTTSTATTTTGTSTTTTVSSTTQSTTTLSSTTVSSTTTTVSTTTTTLSSTTKTSTTSSSTSSTTSSTMTTETTTTLVEFVGILTCDVPVTHSTATVGANSLVSPNPSPEHNYDFVATTAGVYTFDSCDSDFDTYLWVLNSTGGVIAQCDDFCNGTCSQAFRTRVSVALVPGTYRVVLEGHRLSQGTYQLEANCPSGRERRQSTATCDDSVSVSVASRVFGSAGLMADVDAALQRVTQAQTSVSGPATLGASSLRVTCERASPGLVCLDANCTPPECGPSETLYVSESEAQRSCCPYCVARSAVRTLQLTEYTEDEALFAVVQRSQELQHYARSLLDWSQTILNNPLAAPLVDGVEIYLNRSLQAGSCLAAGDCVATTTSTTSTITTSTVSSTSITTTRTSSTSTVTTSSTVSSVTSTSATTTTSTVSSTTSTTTSTLVEFVGTLFCDTPVFQSTAAVGANARPSPNPSAEHNYNFVAPTTGVYTFDTCGSSFDTYLWVIDSAGLVVTACDDFCNGSCPQAFRTRVSVTLAAGNYRVIIEGHRMSEGVYRLNANCP